MVDHHPGMPISVLLSRKTNITELIDAKRLEADPEVERKELGLRKNRRTQIAPKTGLCIRRKDGSILQEHDAATTFTSAILEAGLLKVRELDIRFCRINVVLLLRIKSMGMPSAKPPQAFMSSFTAVSKTKIKLIQP